MDRFVLGWEKGHQSVFCVSIYNSGFWYGFSEMAQDVHGVEELKHSCFSEQG